MVVARRCPSGSRSGCSGVRRRDHRRRLAAAWVGVGPRALLHGLHRHPVPYGALGAELSQDYHDRTRLFAWRQGVGAFGTLVGVVAYYLLLEAERGAGFASRQVGLGVGIFASRLHLRRRRRRWSRACASAASTRSAARARLRRVRRRAAATRTRGACWSVQCSHFFSVAVLSLVSAYVFQYVLRVPSGTASLLVACFAVGVVARIPLWVALSRRFGKHRCWSAALWALGALYAARSTSCSTRGVRRSAARGCVVTALLTAAARRAPVEQLRALAQHAGRRDRLGRGADRRAQGGRLPRHLELRREVRRRRWRPRWSASRSSGSATRRTSSRATRVRTR